ncbi:MAG: serine hydrolase [Candidatus Melainabacteria bacterium]|nr:serine hydrolase [Candidatus Melainabacteria bacterium]
MILTEGFFLPTDLPGKVSLASHQPIAPKLPFKLTERLSNLTGLILGQCKQPKLRAGIFVVEPSTGCYVDIAGQASFSAASMIKIPILVELLKQMDTKTIKPDQRLTIRQDLIAGGSGYLQWRPVGSYVTVAEAAELMIVTSDNTATNLIIDLLGGKEVCNNDYALWGLSRTKIYNSLPDFEGTNQTSPFDLVYLLAKVDKGEILSAESRQFMYKVMAKTRIRTLLPMGLGPGAKIIHKTGDIGAMVGDAGIVEARSGERYFVAVQVERPHNDRRANKLVRDVSRLIYQALIETNAHPKS